MTTLRRLGATVACTAALLAAGSLPAGAAAAPPSSDARPGPLQSSTVSPAPRDYTCYAPPWNQHKCDAWDKKCLKQTPGSYAASIGGLHSCFDLTLKDPGFLDPEAFDD